MSHPTPPPLPGPRTRYVHLQWVRKPDGAVLPKPPPSGARTPNGLIWGHNLGDFFWVHRIPGVDVLTVWSRSMIKEYGENYDENDFNEPDALQVPHMCRPWPVLKVSNDGIRIPKNCCGVVDEGCEKHSQPEYVPKRRDDVAADELRLAADMDKVGGLVKKLLGFDDGTTVFVLNDPYYPLRSPEGNVYAFLFSPQLRAEMFGDRSNLPKTMIQFPQFTTLKVIDGEAVAIQLDEYGFEVMGDAIGMYAGLCDADSGGDNEIQPDSQGVDDAGTSTSSEAQEDTSNSETCDRSEQEDDDRDEGDEPPRTWNMATIDTHHDMLDELSSDKPIPRNLLFSIADIPKLEEDIPKYYFPDLLYVHDPHHVTMTNENGYKRSSSRKFVPRAPMVYMRKYPKLDRDDAKQRDLPTSPDREAHLYLAHQNRMGVGNHSLVHDAPLTLPVPLSAHSRNGMVKVAAKSAFPSSSARRLLANEGKMYSIFPEHLGQDWCGYNLVTPVKHPVPVGPVVPKFFGYYVPVVNGVPCSEIATDAPSPILLIEECGDVVEPHKFTEDDRSECYSMMLRLHYAGITQGSFYVRNILRQPGPLTAPPEKRSKKSPSFRIIDFGRGEEWNGFVGSKSDKERLERKKREWTALIHDEDRRAQRELQIPKWEC